MVRDFARLQLFCEWQLTFTPRDPFSSLFRTIEINCLTARKGGDISERNDLGGADIVAWFSEHVLCSFFYCPPSPPHVLGEPPKETRVSCSTPTGLYLRCPSAPSLHVTAPAAILRIAPSRKRILRPQLRVQAILLLNILRAWEPAPDARVSTK